MSTPSHCIICAALFSISMMVLSGGCANDPAVGYSSLSTFPEQYSTVAVHIFENQTFEREVEFDLADALVKEIEARTPYKVTQSDRADTILTGRIVSVERDQLSKSRTTGLGEEVIFSVTIDFAWRDARSDRTLTERRQFRGDALFIPSAPSSEPVDLARFAVAQKLARDIVDEMRAEW